MMTFPPIAPNDVIVVARSILESFNCLFILVVQPCFSTRICLWLHFSSLRASCFVVFFHSLRFRARSNPSFKARRGVISVTKKPIAVVAGRVLTVTKPRLLSPWSVNKIQLMKHQAYYCVISAASRDQCTVNSPTKRCCDAVCWSNWPRTWEIPDVMTSYIDELTVFLIFTAVSQLLFSAANLSVEV